MAHEWLTVAKYGLTSVPYLFCQLSARAEIIGNFLPTFCHNFLPTFCQGRNYYPPCKHIYCHPYYTYCHPYYSHVVSCPSNPVHAISHAYFEWGFSVWALRTMTQIRKHTPWTVSRIQGLLGVADYEHDNIFSYAALLTCQFSHETIPSCDLLCIQIAHR